MVNIYTDASVRNGKAVATCFIITSKTFIGHNVFEFDNVDTSTLGEIMGAINSIKYAESVTDMSDEIYLFSDSYAMRNLLKHDIKASQYSQVVLYREQLSELKELINKYNIQIKLIKGHQINHNPNKVVDLISNSVLRFNVKEN